MQQCEICLPHPLSLVHVFDSPGTLVLNVPHLLMCFRTERKRKEMSVRRKSVNTEHKLTDELPPSMKHINDMRMFEAQMKAVAQSMQASPQLVEESVARAGREVLQHYQLKQQQQRQSSASICSQGLSRSSSPLSRSVSPSSHLHLQQQQTNSSRPPLSAHQQRGSWSPQATPFRSDGLVSYVISGDEFLVQFGQVFPLGRRPSPLPFD